MTFPLVHLSGTAYEQGLKHGQQLYKQIFHNLDLYFGRFQDEAKLARDVVLERAAIYAEAIRQRAPHYYNGMVGIAEGCGINLLEIVALNVRYEIMYFQYAANAADGCTSIVVDRDRSADGHRYLAQNWDWFPGVAGALLHITEPDGFESLAFTEAGIFGGKIGLNSAGIGLLINGLYSFDDDWRTLDLPFHVRCHQILRQRDFEAALRVVTGSHRACSGNFVVGSAENGVINLETTPDAYTMLQCENGVLAHTNHFLAADEMGVQVPEEDRISSTHRQQRAETRLSERSYLMLNNIKSILADHDGYPNAVCQHGDPQLPTHERYATVTSIILDLDARTMHVAAGNPCCEPFEVHHIAAAVPQHT